MDYLTFVDLPQLIHLKIVRMLDASSIIQLSQTCSTLREIVKCTHLITLILPNDIFSTKNHMDVLKLRLDFDGCSNAGYLNQRIVNTDGLDLSVLVRNLECWSFENTVEVCVNLNYGFPMFAPQPPEHYILLQNIFKKMENVKTLKLSVNSMVQESVIRKIHYQHITDILMNCSAKKVIIKLPAFSQQRFGRLYIPSFVKKVVVIGPCFGFSGKRTYINQSNRNTSLRFYNGICVYHYMFN